MATDFGADGSQFTSWSSRTGDSPVVYAVGLIQSVVLSKIFVILESLSFQKAVLQFFSSTDSIWKDLQYFAVNCNISFGIPPGVQ